MIFTCPLDQTLPVTEMLPKYVTNIETLYKPATETRYPLHN